ncbi:hypothetical protein APR12_001010 [Nocardia amikacinitolerans]|nr:hypothetical protein [Nocardia amikacinitolerans]
MPATHPTANPLPAPAAFFDRIMRIAATIGIGEIATPTASGSNSPRTVLIRPR